MFQAHTTAVTSGFYESKALVKQLEKRQQYRDHLTETLLEQQLQNSYLQEEHDDQADALTTLASKVACLKKEILSGSQRQYKYLEDLNQIEREKEEEISAVREQLRQLKAHRDGLTQRRDRCFQALIDLQVDRRKLLGKINYDEKTCLKQQYSDMAQVKEMRMEPHLIIEEAIESWQEQSQLYGNIVGDRPEISLLPDDLRSEHKNKLIQLIEEIKFKQDHLSKLQSLRDQMLGKHLLRQEEGNVKGKHEQAVDLLSSFLKSTTTANDELKEELDATLKQTQVIEKTMKLQGAKMAKIQEEKNQVEAKLK